MARELVDEALECLKEAVPVGTTLVVFGSHARGDAREDSDIDLLVIEPDVPDSAAEIIRLSTLLGRRLIPADVVVMSRANFDLQREVPNTLAWRAVREGKVHESAR